MRGLRPVDDKFPISAEFGRVNKELWKDSHKGTDFATPNGTPFRFFADGMVQLAGEDPTERLGLRVWILSQDEDGRGYRHGYCHLSRLDVKYGDNVKKGQIGGLTGNSGKGLSGAYPNHLHFQVETWPDRTPVKPEFET